MTFTPKQLRTIANALRVAAWQYATDVQSTRDQPRVAEQFLRQAADAQELALFIEQQP
jgi:hypothetical protein